MLSLTHAGCLYRTKPMAEAAAKRFARCLSSNSRFEQVSVFESRSPGKFFVAYLPTNETRQAEMRATEQGKRQARAESEGRSYQFCMDEGGRFVWCLSTSGEVYEVTPKSCTCPDHTYRCSRVPGLQCKHQLALDSALRRDEVGRF
jgi:predicted nucleic acid-binding Zn finger protein